MRASKARLATIIRIFENEKRIVGSFASPWATPWVDRSGILASTVKDNIHPQWFPNAQVACACGSIFETGSTIAKIRVEACSACHPFFTGQLHKFLDTAGRVDKYNQRVAAAAKKQTEADQRRQQRELAAAAAAE